MRDRANSQGTEELALIMGSFSATMLGVGAMIGAGIFVLSGIAAGRAGHCYIAKPQAWAMNCLWLFAGAVIYGWRNRATTAE